MQPKLHTAELEAFWKDQNDKLKAHPNFIESEGDLFDSIFVFKSSKGTTRLDFSVFEQKHIKLEEPAELNLKGQIYSLSAKEYSKLFFLSGLSKRSSQGVYSIYQMVVHIFAFLNFNEIKSFSAKNIEDFHISFLTQSVNETGFFNRLSAPSYKGTYNNASIINIRNKLQIVGVTGLLNYDLTKNKFISSLDDVCKSLFNISFNQYKQGGSYNSLGLEMGQYYIDYMRQVYEGGYFYTLICRETLDMISSTFKFKTKDADSRVCNRYNRVVLDTIQGIFISNNSEKVSFSRTRNKVHIATKEMLFKQYNIHMEMVLSLSEGCIHQLVKLLGLEMRFDSVEVIRILMLQKYYPFTSHKSSKQVWEGYLQSLDKTSIDSQCLSKISVKDVYRLMIEVVMSHKLNKDAFMKSLEAWAINLMGDNLGENISDLTKEMDRVTHAMTSLVVSWLGYRSSEFGFPLSAIFVEPNLDILDSSYVPFRFKLRWVVPKTHRKLKVDREIISQCYQVAVQLNHLFKPSKNEPCLYKVTSKQKGVTITNESASFIDYRVKTNWHRFVHRYKPFKEVTLLKELSSKLAKNLSHKQVKELETLKNKYDIKCPKTQNLLETYYEVKRDLAKLDCSTFAGGKSEKQFKESLIEFNKVGGISDPSHYLVVEKYLSAETKQWLMTKDVNLNKKAMKDLLNEIKQGVRYPSPHAFRHVWAEAVLNRYQGNIASV